jgi:hypothetical protein
MTCYHPFVASNEVTLSGFKIMSHNNLYSKVTLN